MSAITLFLGLLLAFLIGFALIYKKIRSYLILINELNKIPGPQSYPIVGSMLHLMGTPENTFKSMRLVAKLYGPTFRFWAGVFPVLATTCPENVEIFISQMKNHRKDFLYELIECWLGTGLLTSRGDKWRHRRKILTPSFHFSVLQQFLGVFEKHARTLVKGLKETNGGVVNSWEVITHYTLETLCETSMGISVKDDVTASSKYMRNIEKFNDLLYYRIINPWFLFDASFSLTSKFWQMRRLCKYLHMFSYKVINEREKSFNLNDTFLSGSDEEDFDEVYTTKKKMAMLDVLLKAKHQDGSINNVGIREEVDTFIFEGHDTTATSLCFSLMLLACNKQCQDKAYEEVKSVLGEPNEPMKRITFNELNELKYLERCIKESLRLYPSVPMIARRSEGNTTVEGYYVPKGCSINITIFDMHRRPDLYPEPEKFDPDRFLPDNVSKRHPFAYIPFSAGPRNCIGQKFALNEMKIALATIMKEFSLEPIDTPETITLLPHMVLKTKEAIKMKFVPRY